MSSTNGSAMPTETTGTGNDPCTACPAHVWEWFSDPRTREGERAIRAQERRLALAPFRSLLSSDLLALYAELKNVDLAKGDVKARNLIGLFLHGVSQILAAEDESEQRSA